jgi:hypothetical protein
MITIMKIIATVICDLCSLTNFLYGNNCPHFRVRCQCFRDTRIHWRAQTGQNGSIKMFLAVIYKNRWEVWYQGLLKWSLNFYLVVVGSEEPCEGTLSMTQSRTTEWCLFCYEVEKRKNSVGWKQGNYIRRKAAAGRRSYCQRIEGCREVTAMDPHGR